MWYSYNKRHLNKAMKAIGTKMETHILTAKLKEEYAPNGFSLPDLNNIEFADNPDLNQLDSYSVEAIDLLAYVTASLHAPTRDLHL